MNSYAQPEPGSLDSTFNEDGIQITDFPEGSSIASSIAMQSDGKIILAGTTMIGSTPNFCIMRYNTDGTLDSTFSTDGIQVTNAGIFDASGHSVAIQSDGKIVVSGTIEDRFALVRYNTDGELDSTFSEDGIQTTFVGEGMIIPFTFTTLAIQSDQKIVVAGNGSGNFALLRYNTDGILDSTFNGCGIQNVTIEGGSMGLSVGIQADGKIIEAGYSSETGADKNYALVRFNTDGSLDSTFSEDGIQITDLGTTGDMAWSVLIQPDGKIVLGGIIGDGTTHYFAVVRYNTDGTVDSSFNGDNNSMACYGFDLTGDFYELALQSDGKILMAGSAYSDFALIRFNTDGTVDSSFNEDGKQNTFVPPSTLETGGRAIAIQPDGKILIAGTSYNALYDSYDFTLLRFNGGEIRTPPFCIANYTADYDSTINTFTINVDSATTGLAIAYKWDFGDGTTSTLATPTHVYAIDSLYKVCMKVFYADGDSCTYCHTIGIDSAGNIIRDGGFSLIVQNANTTTGITENSNQKIVVTIYPNPNTGIFQLTIDIGQLKSITQLSIYNLVGEKIYSRNAQLNNLTTIDLSDQPNGIYFMQLKTEERSVTKKIIINK